MTLFRAVPLTVHGVLEILAAPALIAAPFILGFGPATGAASLALGAMLLGLVLSTYAERRTMSLSAHAAFDYTIGLLGMTAGVVLGIASHEVIATIFLVAFGAAHIALTASTRFSARSV